MGRDQILGTNQFTQPDWAVDFLGRDQLLPGGVKLDVATLGVTYPEVTVKLNGNAATDDEALTVDALSGAIPPGTMLNFGSPGLLAYAPNGAAAAATTIVVTPLVNGIADNAEAVVPARSGKSLPSGTAIGRTLAERDANAEFGPADEDDDEIFLLAFPVRDLDRVNDGVPVRAFAGVGVKENYLPGWAGYSADLQAAIRARYICTLGAQ